MLFTEDEIVILLDAYLTHKPDGATEEELVQGINKLEEIRIASFLIDEVLNKNLVFSLDEEGELWFQGRAKAEEIFKQKRMAEKLGGYPPSLPAIKDKLIELRQRYRRLHFQWAHTRPGKIRKNLKKCFAKLKEEIHDVEAVFIDLRSSKPTTLETHGQYRDDPTTDGRTDESKPADQG